jgi:small-conductance mechanosensitive channel
VRSDVNRAIWKVFKERGIKIPVAQRELRILDRPSSRPMPGMLAGSMPQDDGGTDRDGGNAGARGGRG